LDEYVGRSEGPLGFFGGYLLEYYYDEVVIDEEEYWISKLSVFHALAP
jgi:hypothetical protein